MVISVAAATVATVAITATTATTTITAVVVAASKQKILKNKKRAGENPARIFRNQSKTR